MKKRKTTLQVIEILKQRGHSVTFKRTKNGHVYITSIDGKNFKMSSGNMQARKMTGHSLSRKQLKQRRKNARESSYIGLPKGVVEQTKRTRQAQKTTTSKNKISVKNIRKAYKRLGAKTLKEKLRIQERYARGYAYSQNVEWFIDRLENFGRWANYSFGDIVTILRSRIDNIKDKTLMMMYERLYDAEHQTISASELDNYLKSIIDSEIF